MKPSLAIKTLFRTVGKTLFTFLLIAVLTFSLFIQLAEYFKTREEFEATVDSYSGTGYVEYRPPAYVGTVINLPYYLQMDPRVDAIDLPELDQYAYPSLSAETVAELEQLPHTSGVYKRYMTAGVSEDYPRMREDLTRYDFNGRIIIEGTMDRMHVESIADDFFDYQNAFMLRDAKVLAGDARLEDLQWPDGTISFAAPPEEYYLPSWMPKVSAEAVTEQSRQGYWTVRTVYLDNYTYYDTARSGFKEGERYVFVCRFERQATTRMIVLSPHNVTRASLMLYDWASEHCCPAVWNITDAPENYLELPEYAPLKELIEVTETDLNTFDVAYVDNMTAIKQVDDNTMRLREGRWLTPEDTESNAKVCMIDGTLAKKYHLELGDRLSLKLGHETFEQFYSLGAIASVPERFSDEWTEDEFEIVGIYSGPTFTKAASEPNWSYSYNTVFVPLSSLPLTEDELAGHTFYPGEVTIRVDDAWEIEPFLKETAPKIEAMGLTLNFDDGGWTAVLEDYRDAQRIPLIRIVLLAFVTATGLALSVYLFVSRKKQDYAIMRALGTSKRLAGRALLLPILALSLAAVLLAMLAGAIYSLLVIGRMFWLPVLLCLGGELAFTLLFAGLRLWRMGRLPPLELLQASQAAAKKRKEKKSKETGAAVTGTLYDPKSAAHIPYTPLPVTRRSGSLGFRLRYIFRHIRRQAFKSLLAVLLAALLVGAVTQLSSLRDTYNRLRENTVVPVKFVNSLSLTRLEPLQEAGLVKELYYERVSNISSMQGLDIDNIQVVITNDIPRFLNEDCQLTLWDGSTEEDLTELGNVVAGSGLTKKYALESGDEIHLGTLYDFQLVQRNYLFRFLDEEYYSKGLPIPIDLPHNDTLYERYGAEVDQDLAAVSFKAPVLGSIQISSGRYKNALFTAGIDDARSLIGSFQTMPLIEFTLTDNERLEEMRTWGLELTNGREGAFVMDSEALESVIRTSDLLNGLYPAVVALALLIGAAVCALLVMQTTKDAAIMRAQGTTKRTTRSMLAVEQILLGVIGILLGLAVMLAWKRAAFAPIAALAGLFSGAYLLVLILGSYISAGIATRKNILELLQTKE